MKKLVLLLLLTSFISVEAQNGKVKFRPMSLSLPWNVY